jgi:hypothetical protein
MTFGYGRTIPIVGRHQLGTASQVDTDGQLLPNTAAGVEPYGACNGSEAAWR